MSLSYLEVRNLRNISQAHLSFSPQLNLIYGANASGKTSLLEAIYVLGMARSFRCRQIDKLQHQFSKDKTFTLFGRISGGSTETPIGLERTSGKTIMQCNSTAIKSVAEVARLFPLQIIGPESHQLLEMGPKYRRRFIDWGVFHVEQGFLDVWQRFQRVLRQRNAALKRWQKADVSAWTPELDDTASHIDSMRCRYFDLFTPIFQRYTRELFDSMRFQLHYVRGWPDDCPLREALRISADRDHKFGRTHMGPHRADLQITVDGVPVQQYLSRGQQKLLVYALRLSQAAVFADEAGRQCTILVDDLSAELDEHHRTKVMALLAEIGTQTFVTATDPSLLSTQCWQENKVFHVEHGNIQEVV